MADLTKVVLDAMGGDHAPGEMVKGAVDAVSRRQDIKVFLVGQELHQNFQQRQKHLPLPSLQDSSQQQSMNPSSCGLP